MAFRKKKNKPSSENVDSIYLDASHSSLKEIFDNAKDAMLAKYNDGVVHCYVNPSACEMTGYNFSELMNLEFKNLVHPEELSKIEDWFEEQQQKKDLSFCCETRIVTKNGDVVPVEVSITESRKVDNGLSFAILRDLRQRKSLEHEMNKNLNTLNEELIKNKSKWECLNRELIQTHQAMSILAKNIDSKKVQLEEKINTIIKSKVMPIIDELLTEQKIKRFWPEIISMAEHLNSLITKSELYNEIIDVLTETELRVAGMVKNGMASKEIASVMFISLETVKAHRKSIRRKLNISNTKHKLSEYLTMMMGSGNTEL